MVRLKKWCEPQVSIGETGYSGVQAESNGGGHVQRAEENQGELQGVRGGDGSIVNIPPLGESIGDSHATDPGGICYPRGTRDIRGVLTMYAEVGGLSGRRVPI